MAKKAPANKDVAVQVRMDAKLADLIKRAADKDQRSASAWMRLRLEAAARSELGGKAE